MAVYVGSIWMFGHLAFCQDPDTLLYFESMSAADTTVYRYIDNSAGNFVFLDYSSHNCSDATVSIYFCSTWNKNAIAEPTLANNPLTLSKSSPTSVQNGVNCYTIGWEKDFFPPLFALKIAKGSCTSGSPVIYIE